MMEFARETVKQIRPDIEGLIKLHYDEIALNKDRVKLDPDWPMYQHLEDERRLEVYSCRDGGELIGYSVFFLHYHIHYRHLLVAQNDVLFLHPKHRQERVGLRLIDYSEAELTKLKGPDQEVKVMWHIKVEHDWSPILERKGYAQDEKIFGKLL